MCGDFRNINNCYFVCLPPLSPPIPSAKRIKFSFSYFRPAMKWFFKMFPLFSVLFLHTTLLKYNTLLFKKFSPVFPPP